jgi:hypothetical protein
MSPFLKKVVAAGFLLFLALWGTGFVRGLSLPFPQAPAWPLPVAEPAQSRYSNQKVANNLQKLGLTLMSLPAVLEGADVGRIQVYEKSAHLATGTAEFADDEAAVRAALKQYGATVTNETASGLAPSRRLTLEVGVHPDQFDGLVEELRQVGYLESVTVQQRDRTEEFRRLHAQRQVLRKHLDAIAKLRSGDRKLTVEEELKLEQKVQDIEKELQSLGGQLGDLLGKDSVYQIYLGLSEYQPGSRLDRTYTLPRRVGNAFLWAVPWWFAIVATLSILPATWVSVQTLCPTKV